jgi:hypothetical protein
VDLNKPQDEYEPRSKKIALKEASRIKEAGQAEEIVVVG